MMMGTAIGVTFAISSCVMVVLWFVQRRTGDAGIVDVAWAGMIGVFALTFCVMGYGYQPRQTLVGILGAAWAFRLAFHLLIDRVVLASEEDGRYQMLRESWGDHTQRNMFFFYQVQAIFVVAFVFPIFLGTSNVHSQLTGWDFAATGIWFIAIVGESVADRQLARWRNNPENKGKTCRTGFWRYSRHPNYFFEWIHWWAYVLFCVGSPYVWASLAGPVFMLFLLYRVTGIPYTEKRALQSRGDDYRQYQQETSAFFPLPPKLQRGHSASFSSHNS